ncbi:MAG TPA: MFS transporter [bacterium]|nr:MFS transporter [bacterium]
MTTKNFVSIETEGDDLRRRNLYILSGILGFVWIFFHFSVVYFFGLILQSVLLVGAFLAVGNLVAFFLDIPIGVLQKHVSAKKLFMVGGFSILLASLIFLKFIYFTSTEETGGTIIESLVTFFLQDALNIILLLAASMLYGLTKEINDVTILSYILNNSDPSEYAVILSRNNIATGIGSFLGLITAGVIIPLSPFFAIVSLIVVIIVLLVFLARFFDNPTDTVRLGDISRLKLVMERENIEKMREFSVEKIRKIDLAEFAKKEKFIFIKPIEVREQVTFKELVETTKREFRTARDVLFAAPLNHTLLWVFAVILMFGFWDTFVATFQVDFLQKLLEINSGNGIVRTRLVSAYLLLGLLVIPVFLMQSLFIGLSKRIGVYTVVLSGVILSSCSVMLFGYSTDLGLVMLFGFLNSFGYAAAMPLAQASFLDVFNSCHAEKHNLREIDSNASAAPLKMLLNFANIVGLLVGGALVSILGFNEFFFVFGFLLFVLAAVSIAMRPNIKL